jgi:predicted AAA+ superfamily ATPase
LSENNNITAETYEIYVRWILGDLNKLNRKEKIFKNIITGIIKNYTSKFSLHAIAKETEIKSHITVGEYVDDLQSLLLCNILYQAEINKKISLYRKERKCYFFDPFLFSVFSGYIKGRYQDYSEESKDKIIEGIVCETLNRVVRNDFDTSSYLWFFVKKKETDFVINQNDGLIGVELKYSNKVQFNDFNNFSMFKTRIILSKKDFNFNEYKNTIIIPVHLFLSLIK